MQNQVAADRQAAEEQLLLVLSLEQKSSLEARSEARSEKWGLPHLHSLWGV